MANSAKCYEKIKQIKEMYLAMQCFTDLGEGSSGVVVECSTQDLNILPFQR